MVMMEVAQAFNEKVREFLLENLNRIRGT